MSLGLTILCLLYWCGLVGGAVIVSHWFTHVDNALWAEVFGQNWRNVGQASSFLITIGIVVLLTAFTFGKVWWGFGIGTGLQLIGFCLAIALLIRIGPGTAEEIMKTFEERYHTLPRIDDWSEHMKCTGMAKDGLCVEDDTCCDPIVDEYAQHYATLVFKWLLGFTLFWLISVAGMVPVILYIFKRSGSRTPYAN